MKKILVAAVVVVLMLAALGKWTHRNDPPLAHSPVTATTGPESAKAPDEVLDATVTLVGITAVRLANVSKEPWQDVALYVNKTSALSNGYTFRVASLAAGKSVSVPLIEFATFDGQRFNPLALKPQSVFVTARLPSGRAASMNFNQ